MAEGDETEKSPDYGFGMRLTLSGIRSRFPSVEHITTATLSSWIRKVKERQASEDSSVPGNLVILDSRPEEEYVISHLADSIRVDYNQPIEETINSIPQLKQIDQKTTVVCYCSVGYRSCIVAENLESYFSKRDITPHEKLKVYNLEGSIFQWANEGRPMIDCNQISTIVAHPYNAIFGKLLQKELRKNKL